jgi:hypothetical protein
MADAVPPIPAVALMRSSDYSLLWSVSNVQVKCDVIQLDNNLNDEYVKYLLSGKALAINYSTYISQIQTIAGQTNAVNITRAVSRLKSVFITFGVSVEQLTIEEQLLHSYFNTFFHPMNDTPTFTSDGLYDSQKELEWQVQIGSRLYPENSCRSVSESMYQLHKCMGTLNSGFHSSDINSRDYRHLKYIIGLDLEKVLGAGFTGINTKAGDLMTIKTKSLSSGLNATSMHVILHSDCILNIRDSGVEVFE